MTVPIVVGVLIAVAVVLAYAYFQRQRAILSAENEKLRDKLLEKTVDDKVETLEMKLDADKKSGDSDEKAFHDFRNNHPELFPSDPSRKR